MDSTGWVLDGYFRVWCMETFGENADACFEITFIRKIPSSFIPYRWNSFEKCYPSSSKHRVSFWVQWGSELVLLYIIGFGTWSLTPLLLSAVGGTTLSLAYGIEIKPTNDPFVKLAEQTMDSITKATSSLWVLFIDLIPILKYVPEFVPGAGFKKQARIGRKLAEDFREQPYLASVEAMVCGTHFLTYTILSLYYLGLWSDSTLIHINHFGRCGWKSWCQSPTRGNKGYRRQYIRRYALTPTCLLTITLNTTQLGLIRLFRQSIHFSLPWSASLKSSWKHRQSSTASSVGGFPTLAICQTCHICPHLSKKLSGWLLKKEKSPQLIFYPSFRWEPVLPYGMYALATS